MPPLNNKPFAANVFEPVREALANVIRQWRMAGADVRRF